MAFELWTGKEVKERDHGLRYDPKLVGRNFRNPQSTSIMTDGSETKTEHGTSPV